MITLPFSLQFLYLAPLRVVQANQGQLPPTAVLEHRRGDVHVLRAKQEEWREQGLTLFFLPTYSPELNIIEILWRFIKYKWLEVDAYSSWKSLVEAVEEIFRNYGEKYIINFA